MPLHHVVPSDAASTHPNPSSSSLQLEDLWRKGRDGDHQCNYTHKASATSTPVEANTTSMCPDQADHDTEVNIDR